MPKKRAHILIWGLVQGVFFRAHAKRVADSLGLAGWVRNLPDGRVEALVEGEEEAVSKFIEWCRRGPPLAKVEQVQVRFETPKGEPPGFSIVR
ncbi:MAG: acylphosphatase [Nitrososphaerota archaeon]